MENMEQPIIENEENIREAQDLCPHDGSMLGKFSDVSQLSKAYENLQSEFTRKSQELAKLKNEKAEQKTEVKTQEQPKPQEVKTEQVLAGTIDREQVIKDYLLSVQAKKNAPAVITGGACGFVTKGAETVSMNTAGKLAENFFRTKGS